MKQAVLLLIVCTLFGCASSQVLLLKDDPSLNQRLPPKAYLSAPFTPQKKEYCGPASVAMLLGFFEKISDTYRLQALQMSVGEDIFTANAQGTYSHEIIGYLRSKAYVPYVLEPKLHHVLSAISDGYPVLILQNLGFNHFYPRWHYALAIGYDLDKKVMILHSGAHPNYEQGFKTFFKTWSRSNHWALAAWPMNQTRYPVGDWVNAQALEQNVIETDQLNLLANPVKAYQGFLNAYPNSARAWFRLANHQYNANHVFQSMYSLIHAARPLLQQDNQQAMHGFYQSVLPNQSHINALNNLSYVARELGCRQLANMAIECAMQYDPTSKQLQRTHQDIQSMAGAKLKKKAQTCPKMHCNSPQRVP